MSARCRFVPNWRRKRVSRRAEATMFARHDAQRSWRLRLSARCRHRTGAQNEFRCVPKPPCSPGMTRNAVGDCVCPPDHITMRTGADGAFRCVARPPCTPPTVRNAAGECMCPPDYVTVRTAADGSFRCVTRPACPPPSTRNAASGACECPPDHVTYREGNDTESVRCFAKPK
jgi:hypothetical protein